MSDTLTQQDIVRAVTNDPTLSTRQVVLGDTVIKIVDLDYDDYTLFVLKLEPMLRLIVGGVLKSVGFESQELPTSPLDSNSLLKYCAADIPELALLCVKATHPEMTIESLKKLAKSPFKLAAIIIKQIEHNQVITEVGDFFVQILPFLPKMMQVRQK